MIAILLFTLLAVAVGGLFFGRGWRERHRQAAALANDLVPEIRAILADMENRAVETACYTKRRHELSRLLPRETVFAIETFYQCAAALHETSDAMRGAFSEDSELGLGDKIRAKDRRDRSLKDVYYSGEAAIERLDALKR